MDNILRDVWQYRDHLDVKTIHTEGSAVVAVIGSVSAEQPAIDVVLEALNEGGPMFAGAPTR